MNAPLTLKIELDALLVKEVNQLRRREVVLAMGIRAAERLLAGASSDIPYDNGQVAEAIKLLGGEVDYSVKPL